MTMITMMMIMTMMMIKMMMISFDNDDEGDKLL